MIKFIRKCIAWFFIPRGPYCHFPTKKCRCKPCRYWSINKEKSDVTSWGGYRNGGYCSYLKKGDWDINADDNIIFINKKTGERTPSSEMPFGVGLLWDQCKECGIKEVYLEDYFANIIRNIKIKLFGDKYD